jgi:hypothetical protein
MLLFQWKSLLILVLISTYAYHTHGFSFSCSERAKIPQIERKQYASLSMQFSLQSYVKDNLLVDKTNTNRYFINVAHSSIQDAVENYDESIDYVFLVDVSARQLADLDNNYQFYPFWDKFVAKLNNTGKSLSSDKFIYDFDMGEQRVSKVTNAITLMLPCYRLVLNRAIASVHLGNYWSNTFENVSEIRFCKTACIVYNK